MTFSFRNSYETLYFTDVARALDDGNGLGQALAAVKDGNGRGPLHFAARGGCDELCQYMVDELKLSIDARDNDGTFLLVLVPAFAILFGDFCVIAEQYLTTVVHLIFSNVSL